MIETEWYRIKKDRAASGIRGEKGFQRKDYPYFMDWKAFDALETRVAFYDYSGRAEFDDFLFEPTFMLSDRFRRLFQLLEPEMEFQSVNLLDEKLKEKAPSPVYWIPYLPCAEAIHPASRIVQGKAENLVLKRGTLEGKRVLHCHLPADDIWLISLEAAECILRRAPIGIGMEKLRTIAE